MKIAVIAHPRFPIAMPFAGGLEAFVASLLDSYSRFAEVYVYAHPASKVNGKLISFPFDTEAHARFPEIVENDFLLKVMADITKRNIDVVHNNAISSIPPLWAAKYNIPLLTTLHTPPYSKLKAAAELASYAPNVHYNAVSYSVAEQWRPFLNDDIDVIYNGIDLSRWSSKKTNPEYVFSFGRILPSKGFDLAIQCANQLGIDFKFAGPVFDQHYFNKSIAPLLNDRVTYLGHLTHDSINSYLLRAQAAIFAVRWDEPFGLSTVEAMATGTPVAAFRRGAFPEVVAESGGRLASGNNVLSLTEALSKTLSCHQDEVLDQAAQFPLEKMCSQYQQKLIGML